MQVTAAIERAMRDFGNLAHLALLISSFLHSSSEQVDRVGAIGPDILVGLTFGGVSGDRRPVRVCSGIPGRDNVRPSVDLGLDERVGRLVDQGVAGAQSVWSCLSPESITALAAEPSR